MARRTSFPLPIVVLLLLVLPLFVFCVASPVDSPSSTSLFTTTTSSSLANSLTLLPTTNVNPVLELEKNSTISVHSDQSNILLNYKNRRRAKEADDLARSIENDPAIQSSVRSMTLEGYGSLVNWTLISTALSHIHQLDDLHWHTSDPVPAVVLSILRNVHPKSRLHCQIGFNSHDPFRGWVNGWMDTPEEAEYWKERSATRLLILNSTNLYSLKIAIIYGDEPNYESMKFVHNVLATCPNFRKLDLSVSHDGCVVSGGQPYSFDFSPRNILGNATLAPLVELKLSGYRLDDDLGSSEWEWSPGRRWHSNMKLNWPWNKLPKFVIDIFPAHFIYKWGGVADATPPSKFKSDLKNIDGWMEVMDWSQMRRLDFHSISCENLRKLRPVLTNLDSFTLHYGSSCTAKSVIDFLANATKPQTSLHLSNILFESINPLLDAIEQKHNNSLTSFTLYEHEDARRFSCWYPENRNNPQCNGTAGSTEWRKPHLFFTPNQLQRLNDLAPDLTKLDIDVDVRNMTTDEWTNIVDELAAFSNLHKLTLRITSPTLHKILAENLNRRELWDERKHDPTVNQTWVEHLFHSLRVKQSQLRNPSISSPYLPPYLNITSHPATPSSASSTSISPSLTSLEIIIGPWSNRHAHGMVQPDKIVVGHWDCTIVSESNSTLTTTATSQPSSIEPGSDVAEREMCKGRLEWPDYWEMDDFSYLYEDSMDTIAADDDIEDWDVQEEGLSYYE